MKVIRHILLSLLTIIILYACTMLLLKNITYKGRPIIYITNNYYSWKGGDTYEKYKEFRNDKNYDIIFIGSSRAYRGYSPFLFGAMGYTSFNLGTSAQSIKNTYFVVKHYIDSSNCKLLVVDLFAGAFIKDQLESSSDLIENLNKPNAAYDIAINNIDVRTINMAALRYLTEDDSPYFKKTDYLGEGYSVKSDSLNFAQKKIVATRGKVVHKKLEIDEDQIDYFKKVIELCVLKKIKVIFVHSPVSYFYDYSIHIPFLDKLNPIIKEHSIHFYDFSKCDAINTVNHFYDESHLNQAGVQVFNKLLLTRLEENKILLK